MEAGRSAHVPAGRRRRRTSDRVGRVTAHGRVRPKYVDGVPYVIRALGIFVKRLATVRVRLDSEISRRVWIVRYDGR